MLNFLHGMHTLNDTFIAVWLMFQGGGRIPNETHIAGWESGRCYIYVYTCIYIIYVYTYIKSYLIIIYIYKYHVNRSLAKPQCNAQFANTNFICFYAILFLWKPRGLRVLLYQLPFDAPVISSWFHPKKWLVSFPGAWTNPM